MDSTVLILFAAVVIVGAALLATITFMGKRHGKVLNQQMYRENWLSIEQSLRDDDSSSQLAIIRADKLLDQALKDRGFSGQTMGERLKSARATLKDNNAVWGAHKVRNRIAHEQSVHIDIRQARSALAAFKSALRDVGAL